MFKTFSVPPLITSKLWCTVLPWTKKCVLFAKSLCKMYHYTWTNFILFATNQPLEIFVDDETKLTLHGLQQYYVKLEEKSKNRKLNDLLDSLEFNQVCIFVKSVNRAIELNKLLTECNFPSICIHSHMPQEERITRYKAFKDFSKRIMVATDIFGRGIDVERVNIVINYDMPDGPDSYLHRVWFIFFDSIIIGRPCRSFWYQGISCDICFFRWRHYCLELGSRSFWSQYHWIARNNRCVYLYGFLSGAS